MLLYIAYMVYAIWYDSGNAFLLLFDTCIVSLWIAAHAERSRKLFIIAGKKIVKANRTVNTKIPYLRIIFTVTVVLVLLVFLIHEWVHVTRKLIPFGGLILLLFLTLLTSRSPSKIKWTPVIWGILLQFLFGLIILRWPIGYGFFQFIAGQISAFLSYTDNASKIVFGEEGIKEHPIVFKVLPVVVFFNAITNVLYYLGAMQVIIRVIARVIRFVMKTLSVESFAVAAQIFLGQAESSIALKPFLKDVSRSGLNSVMTGGFATIACTYIAAYIEFGVSAQHLVAASFMSAPAALAVAKLGWPEDSDVEEIDLSNVQLDVGQETNILEAASVGATATVKLVAYVVVNLIAFLAILSFLDAAISFYGERVGHPEINFEWLCSYIFMPLAIIMGIPWNDCRTVATLIGKKIVLHDFLAYMDLGRLVKEDKLEDRSAVIATYILCGFGSIASIGVTLGALTAAEPSRRKDYARGVFRAFVCGNVACFMTACIAGMLYTEFTPVIYNNTTDCNMTSLSSCNTTMSNSSLYVLDLINITQNKHMNDLKSYLPDSKSPPQMVAIL
ncbi:solute carrier family 28 member 3-like [Mytilus edulis]|uniref:solute carrier family 28 member 3-like n=1 Tax=Mytilus edulis TaxID=6550 RepID=UPI0039F0FD9F